MQLGVLRVPLECELLYYCPPLIVLQARIWLLQISYTCLLCSQCIDSQCTPPMETRLTHDALPLDTSSLGMAATEPCYDVHEFYRGSSSSAEFRSGPLPGTGGSVVAQCVDLLQRDPDVQVPLPIMLSITWSTKHLVQSCPSSAAARTTGCSCLASHRSCYLECICEK